MMVSCSDETSLFVGSDGNLPISISAEYPVKGVSTRATDNGFQDGDAVGLFVVDYNSNGTPGELLMKGNRADNVRFDFNGANWTANYQIYWANKNTPADFYGYYPFNAAMQSVTEHDFSVYANQDGITADKSNYEQSDLLWAKAGPHTRMLRRGIRFQQQCTIRQVGTRHNRGATRGRLHSRRCPGILELLLRQHDMAVHSAVHNGDDVQSFW